MAMAEPEVLALLAGTGLAVGAPAVYGLVDMVSGPTHALNSGEFFMNDALASAPVFGAVLGGGAGAMLTPAGRSLLDGLTMETIKDDIARLVKTPIREGVPGADPAEVTAQFQAKMAQGRVAWADAAKRRQTLIEQAMQQNPALNRAQANQLIERRGGRALWGGALLGALAAGVPAIMAMQDQPAPSQPAS